MTHTRNIFLLLFGFLFTITPPLFEHKVARYGKREGGREGGGGGGKKKDTQREGGREGARGGSRTLVN